MFITKKYWSSNSTLHVQGKEEFNHENKNRVPHNCIDHSISEKIISLYKDKYFDYNYAHFVEKLNNNEHLYVSESYVRNLLNKNGFISHKAHRITTRNHTKKSITSELN